MTCPDWEVFHGNQTPLSKSNLAGQARAEGWGWGVGGSSPCPFSKLLKRAPLRQISMILWSIKQNAFK